MLGRMARISSRGTTSGTATPVSGCTRHTTLHFRIANAKRVARALVLAAATGFWDWLRSTEKGTQARRTANVHAWTMIGVTALALTDIALRVSAYDSRSYPTIAILVLSIVVALLVAIGAAFGGTLVFDYGFNVETAGDSPVWHQSETDVLPGDHAE